MHPKLSIIIPCYNYGQYIEETVHSVFASTYENIEVIIVDDGSTDLYTIEVLNKLKRKAKVTVIRRENGGLAAARNTGISFASSPYVLLLDADDLIESTFIEKGIELLESNKNYSYVYPLVQLFGEKNKTWITLPFNFFYLKFRNYIPATIIIRRSSWEKVKGYDENMREGYEDWEFLLRLGKKGLFGARINEILFFYRKHSGSMLEDSKKKHWILKKRIRKKHPDLYQFYFIQFIVFLFIELFRRITGKILKFDL
ncbi:glycosyltransferase family 2 protein [Aneurinibacillus migulanus]|uniref:glycosyltransferase family 2 protein n=1 Tax=Aneurinibacillus migulanus TaxID=47500 RepID=UPI0006A03205|nr:glycosyltransferase family A protein [Aneurinibacillus migulanus]MCP1357020.1 glycosyltransferase family 2 protein [Aneurinibacillus migulanus]CEH30655.1 Glycosyl transferase family 2 [Aneurinibacillus migulanus]